MQGDTDFEPVVEEVAPVLSPEPPKPKRRTSADKWNAMPIEERLTTLEDMAARQMLPAGHDVRQEIAAHGEEIETRFCMLRYDAQEKVIAYFRKNFADLD